MFGEFLLLMLLVQYMVLLYMAKSTIGSLTCLACAYMSVQWYGFLTGSSYMSIEKGMAAMALALFLHVVAFVLNKGCVRQYMQRWREAAIGSIVLAVMLLSYQPTAQYILFISLLLFTHNLMLLRGRVLGVMRSRG